MGNVSPFRRLRWGPPRDLSRPHFLRGRHSLFGGLGRYSGLLALAALIGGVFLYQSGYWPASIGAFERITERYSEIRIDNRTIRFANRPGAEAIDGDSLRYGNAEVRLMGIDAPEYRQTCRDERGRDWACGREARAQLAALLTRGEVRCAFRSRDRYGRTLAVCSAGEIADVGEALVRAGYAMDFMGGGYGTAEAEARAAKRGIWRGEFEQPQAWRAKNRRAEG